MSELEITILPESVRERVVFEAHAQGVVANANTQYKAIEGSDQHQNPHLYVGPLYWAVEIAKLNHERLGRELSIRGLIIMRLQRESALSIFDTLHKKERSPEVLIQELQENSHIRISDGLRLGLIVEKDDQTGDFLFNTTKKGIWYPMNRLWTLEELNREPLQLDTSRRY